MAKEPENTEFRDDRFTAAIDRKSDDKAVFTVAYIVRAVSPGKYVLPQAYVEDMYNPSRYGRTGTGECRGREGEMNEVTSTPHAPSSPGLSGDPCILVWIVGKTWMAGDKPGHDVRSGWSAYPKGCRRCHRSCGPDSAAATAAWVASSALCRSTRPAKSPPPSSIATASSCAPMP